MLPSKAKLSQYYNRDVLNRYTIDHPNNKLTNEEAFAELMKYFWLCEKHRIDQKAAPSDELLEFVCAIHSEMSEIDDMWHTFLLFTKDYMDFCHEYFGEYIHHLPNVEEAEAEEGDFGTDFQRYLSYIYDELGEETLKIWFSKLLENEHEHEHEHDYEIAVEQAS